MAASLVAAVGAGEEPPDATLQQSLYEVLGVQRDASAADIKKAYRKQALLNHPDKHGGDEARFIRVTVAYDVLRDEVKRSRYDRGEGEGAESEMYQGFGFGRANDMFNVHFGQALMQRWAPGLTVRGSLVSDGRRISITIHPDGTTEEHTNSPASSLYTSLITTTTMKGGGTFYTLLFRTRFGENLAELLVPDEVARRPIIGRLATTVVSWMPTLLFGCLALRLYNGRTRVPGELPDALAAAFKQLPGHAELIHLERCDPTRG